MEGKEYICKHDPDGNCLLISFSGRMDAEFIDNEMTDILGKVKEHKGDVKMDLAAVDYVSSSFLRLCVAIARDEHDDQKRKVSVTRLSPMVKKVFKIAGFDSMIAD